MKESDVLASLSGRRRALLGAGLAVAAAPLRAQEAWPAKPVRVVIPFPPGGGGDTLARLVMPRVGKEVGANFVMENIAGAGGNIGARQVAQSPADGYTLLYGTNGTHGINQTLYEKPGFDAQKDFAPISQLTRIAAMVVVRPGLGANTMPELLKLLKSNPGKLTFASAGNGTTSHLAGELLKASAGVFMVHIPYRGGGPAMTDVIGGQVDLMIDVMPNAAPHVRSGRLRGLAVSTARRVPTFPNVPTIAESGVPGFDVSAWDAVFAPAGTPPAIVRRLNEAIVKVLGDAELRAGLLERGAEVTPSTPDELAKFIAAEIPRWGAAIKRSNAKVE